MKFELEEYHRGITDDELLADLKRVALEFNRTLLLGTSMMKKVNMERLLILGDSVAGSML